ncbi:Fc.00g097610.m01.CDS01 [Cosmosporella sp. VM-42]
MDDEENGLFNLTLSISDDSADEAPTKARRTDQTEEAFQAIKREYKSKVENGDIVKNVKLPLGPDAPKPHIQEAIHAVEELYFFRKYDEATEFVKDVLSGADGLDDETRQLLSTYADKCRQKLAAAV